MARGRHAGTGGGQKCCAGIRSRCKNARRTAASLATSSFSSWIDTNRFQARPPSRCRCRWRHSSAGASSNSATSCAFSTRNRLRSSRASFLRSSRSQRLRSRAFPLGAGKPRIKLRRAVLGGMLAGHRIEDHHDAATPTRHHPGGASRAPSHGRDSGPVPIAGAGNRRQASASGSIRPDARSGRRAGAERHKVTARVGQTTAGTWARAAAILPPRCR
jgi:hypothetical protein